MTVYVAEQQNIAITGAVTLIQVNAPSNASLRILEAYIDFVSTTSTAIRVQLLRMTTAGTGTTVTPLQVRGRTLAAGATATRTHTAEGTAGDILRERVVNYLNGFQYQPIPEQMIVVPPSGRLALRLPAAPGASVNITAGIVWEEIG
jgi:hypothetical protein